MSIYANLVNQSTTPQTEALFGETQVKNNAGGFVYQLDPLSVLLRFLILGSEGGTYYVSERKLTEDNAKGIVELIKTQGLKVVETIVDVSVSGRAHKNDPAIFALALAATHGDEPTRKTAYDSIVKVCRTGTHIFLFTELVNKMRGWSAGLRRGVSSFYSSRNPEQLALQLIKYRQREGWTHKDVLRMCHASSKEATANSLLRWTVGKEVTEKHAKVEAFEKLQALGATNVKQSIKLIKAHRLPREALPTELLSDKSVWDALLPDMQLTALIRNLGKMTSIGLLNSAFDDNVKLVISKLQNKEQLKAQRVHPFQVLYALKTYGQGKGVKGSLTWDPVQKIVDALDDAFYEAFNNVEPTGLNHLLALDVSGSMTTGSGIVSPRVASAAMAMLVYRTEPSCEVMGFSNKFIKIKVSAQDRLETVIKTIDRLPFSSTDCSLPMIYAKQQKLPIDVFHVYTDNETYAGAVHPSVALRDYRKTSGRDAKLCVVGMEATPFTIADPNDPGMMDVVGFDASAPLLMADFARGFKKSEVSANVANPQETV